MNIFVLDLNPEKAAQMLCDAHVVKMCLETAQILSAALHLSAASSSRYERQDLSSLYLPTHLKHPCVLWAQSCPTHFSWLVRHGRALVEEYAYRFRATHKSSFVIAEAQRIWSEAEFGTEPTFTVSRPQYYAGAFGTEFLAHPAALDILFTMTLVDGKWYKPSDVVKVYRNYYVWKLHYGGTQNKGMTMRYTRRGVPSMFRELGENYAKQSGAADSGFPVRMPDLGKLNV